MKVNSKKISSLRLNKAWSQQHLADVSGVSLRTIQRVENNGTGSLDTIKALASCFEIDVNYLFEIKPTPIPNPQKSTSKSKTSLAAASSLFLALLASSIFLSSTSMASSMTISAKKMTASKTNDYHEFSDDVEIFLPNDVVFDLLIDSKWETKTPSNAQGRVKVTLEKSIIYIDNAAIKRTKHGTNITSNYAKMTILE